MKGKDFIQNIFAIPANRHYCMLTKKIKNYRWLIVVLLFFATTINYLDRQVIGLLKPILEKEFNWTETDFAHIVMAFTAAYAIGLLSFGWLIDKIGTKLG